MKNGIFLNAAKKWPMYMGSTACTLAFLLWLILWFDNPYTTEEPGEIITSPGVLMVLFCIAGFVAAIKSKPMIMLIVSLLSFCPIGWYMLASPGIFNWIGWLNIVYFFSAIGMFCRYKRK